MLHSMLFCNVFMYHVRAKVLRIILNTISKLRKTDDYTTRNIRKIKKYL